MQVKSPAGGLIRPEMIDTLPIEGRGPPDDSVNLVALVQKQFRQIGSILPCNAGNQSPFHGAENSREAVSYQLSLLEKATRRAATKMHEKARKRKREEVNLFLYKEI